MWHAILGVSRLNFLTFTLATLACTFAWLDWQSVELPLPRVLFATALALLGHIAVNAWNEYLDFRSGLDLTTQRTPFSGGSGTLPNHPAAAPTAKWFAIVTTTLLTMGGLWWCFTVDWQLAWFGVGGLLLILLYTGPINRQPWLCWLAPGLGFGGVICAGSVLAFMGSFPTAALWPTGIMLLLANNLLLLNQLPDIEADQANGRRHLAIVYGTAAAVRLFQQIWLLTFALVIIAVSLAQLPLASLWVLLLLPVYWRLYRASQQTTQLCQAMTLNVVLVHLVPLLLAVAWFFSPPAALW